MQYKITITTLAALLIAALAYSDTPNVLLIMADDMKPSIGAYGDPVAVTPHMDALAAEGVTFTNTSCVYPVCGSSRASLTTSLMPEETQVFGFEMIRAVLADVIMLPEHFRNNGYNTVGVGKVHDHRTIDDPSGTLTSNEDTNSWSVDFVKGGGMNASRLPTNSPDPGTTGIVFMGYYQNGTQDCAVKLYNPNANTLNLSQYSVRIQDDGAGAFTTVVNLSGTLASETAYLVVNTAARSELTSIADLTDSGITFDGKDVIGLFQNGVLVDTLGEPGGSDWGTGVHLDRRGSSDSIPNTTYSSLDWQNRSLTDYSKLTTWSRRMMRYAAEAADNDDEDKLPDALRCVEGMNFIEQLGQEYLDTGKPFFIAVGFARPHLPFFAPQAYWDYYDRNDFYAVYGYPQTMHENATNYVRDNVNEMEQSYALNVDPYGYFIPFTWNGSGEPLPDPLSVDNQLTLMHGYYASVSFVDHQVGRLLQKLEDMGLENDTIVVLLGDHGFHLGDHNKWGKHTPLEGAVESPLIIKVPGLGQHGVKTHGPTSFLDIYPTLCDLTGLPYPTHPVPEAVRSQYGGATELPLRGESLVPVLNDPSKSLRFGAIAHYRSGPFGYSYRTKRYRYLEFVSGDGSVRPQDYELFDHYVDPHEARNIAYDPGNELILYRLSVKMRQESETPGAHRLRYSPAYPLDLAIYNADEDGDGLSNGYEVDVTDTNPFSIDTDSDGAPDNTDSHPLDPSQGGNPANADTIVQWKNQHQASPDENLSDIDGDGQVMLLEYALGRSPMHASDHASLSGKLDGSQKLSLEIVSRRSDIPTDISVKVMGSNDLGDSDPWVEVSTTDSVVNNGDGTWTHVFTQQTPVDSGGKQFLRLQVDTI